MAYDYNRAKELWEWMDQAQKQQYVQNNKNDANFQRFAQEYHNETYDNWSSSSNSSNNQNNTVTTTEWTNTTTSNTNTSNSNNQNGTNWSYDPIYYRSETTWNTGNNNQGWSTLSDWKNGNGNFYGNTSFDKEEQFDKSMIGDDPWKITIQAGTGKTTGRPDYEDSSDARINELTDNLNRYYQTNPEYFADRETFNRQFEYNQRMSDRQRATLDSYWKKAQDIKTASQYTTWDRISAGMDNAEITPDVFNLIKQNNPEAYAQYQKEMQDWINKCMANLSFTGTEPLDVTLEKIINKLGIWVWDPHDIKKVYYDSLDKLNVWKDSEQLHVLWNNISSMMSTMNSNAQSLSSQLEGRYSAGYIEARINKANSNIQRQLNTALNSYQMLLQWRQQNIALATQNAQIEQAQAQEEQRIFDDKLKALWFAMDYNSYRTPEQKAALELQKEQISNNMDVLKQSQLNDLALYNKYANAKLDNQLNYEMQDLTVSDPKQLRANLSNVLDQWYSQYWDIIERPKSQVIEDVLAYAKENWVSVWEALRQEFVKKLMEKPEYQKSINNKLGIKEDTYSWTIDKDWNIIIEGSWTWTPNLTEIEKQKLLANKDTYEWSWMKGAWLRNNNPWNIKDTWFWNVLWTDDRWFAIFSCPEDWFDALVEKIENIQRWWSKVYSPNMTLYDFFSKYAPSSDNNNPKAYAESVAKQLWTNASAKVSSVDATKFAAAIAKHDSWYNYSTYWQYRASNNTAGNLWDFSLRDWTTYDTSKAPTYNSLTYDQQKLVMWLLNLSTNPATIDKRKYWDDFEKIKSAVLELNPNWTEWDYWQADKVRKEWNTSSKNGSNSRNATAAATAKEIYDMADDLWNATFKDWNAFTNFLKKRVSNEKFLELQVNMQTMASEFAWALKGWNAAPTTEEINDAKDLLAASFSKWGMKAAAKQIIRQLYNKNVTEADNYRAVTLEKPNPIWIGDLPDFMVNELWLNLSDYYNYKWLWDYFTDDEFDKTNDSDDDFIIYMTNWKK